MATIRQINRDISRMGAVLEKFNRMEPVDRWYVLTRIAQADDPRMFRQVAQENPTWQGKGV